MKKIFVEKVPETPDEWKKFISEMEVDYYYYMPDTFYYKYIKVEHRNFDMRQPNSKEYIWGMEYNYAVSGMVMYRHPLRTSQLVQTWKTESGCKRNLFKALNHIYKNN